MLNNATKRLLIVGTVAVLGGSYVSHHFGERVQASPSASTSFNRSAPPASSGRSWFGSMFEGISFSSKPPAARPPAAAPRPAPVMATGSGAVSITADRGGQYNTAVEIDGQQFPMLVDTGATVMALRHEDAQRLGISPMPGDYTVAIATANGQMKAARTMLREVRVGNITVRDVTAVVMPEGALDKSLLGMSFLGKLARFEVADGNLILRP